MGMIQLDLLATLAAFFFVLYLYLTRPKCSSDLPLPPGPKGLPLIGCLLDMPTSFEWKTYHKWCKDFGTDIIHLNVAGTSIVVLDTSEVAAELLEKRSSIYSGRARMPMINELMGWNFNFGFMIYGDRWRKHRRLMHQTFHPSAARLFRPHELKASHSLLRRFLTTPDDIIGNLRHMAGQTIMSIAYGLEVQPKNDPYIKTAEEGVHPLVAAGVPGAFLVDTIAILKYVPEWVPGAGFQRKAKAWKELATRMIETPFQAAKRHIENGNAVPSFTSYCLQRMDEGTHDNAYQEDIIQGTAGTMYAAGSDTTVSAIASCILGLLERPDVLKRAQDEIDSVVKPGHLPDFDDEDSLPFITAIVKETLRWRDVVPISIPHLVHVEDEYKGYRIPAGTVVVPNGWAMLHNEEVYPDPLSFKPERFIKDGKIDKSVRDPDHACFGFGRRICPGRYMAFSAIWIAVVSLIAVFDFKKAIDEEGREIELTHEYISALVCVPKPYKCSIKPRSKATEALIKATENDQVELS